MDTITLRYIDHRPVFIPRLKYYPGGVLLPGDVNEIKCTAKEARGLMRQKNADKNCFEIVNKKPVSRPVVAEENNNE